MVESHPHVEIYDEFKKRDYLHDFIKEELLSLVNIQPSFNKASEVQNDTPGVDKTMQNAIGIKLSKLDHPKLKSGLDVELAVKTSIGNRLMSSNQNA